MLRGLINSHPDLACDGEVFNPGAKAGRPRMSTSARIQRTLATQGSGAVAHMFHGWQGVQPHWTNPREYNDLFKLLPQDTKVIVLQRWNLLRRFVSHQLGDHHRKWQIRRHQAGWRRKAERIRNQRLVVDSAALRQDIDAIRQLQSTTGLAYTDSFVLTYESLCAAPLRYMRRIYEHLDVDPALCPAPTTNTVKVGIRSLSSQIENYTELKQEFTGTDLECYFDE